MTQPRCVLPGTTVLITRRVQQRTHLLRPDAELNRIYCYSLAVAAKKYGIRVHAVVLMSTHEHLMVTDTRGTLPSFVRELHRLVALAVKVLRKWDGAVWDNQRPSIVQLRTPDAVIEKLAYLMANPVAAGLVRCAKDWPGVQTLPEHLGRASIGATRPSAYFAQDNPLWPEHASLELSMPEVGELSDEEIRDAVRIQLADQEQQAQADVKARGWSFIGGKRVLKGSPYDRAKSWEPLRGRNPQFAVGANQKEAFADAVAALRGFRRAYRDALDSWRAGVRTALFPAGTWIMRVLHCAPVMLAP